MRMKLNRTAALALGGLALAGIGGGAFAAAQTGEDRQAFLNDAAERLGVEPSELENAFEEAAVARVDAAVAAGRLTEEQATELKERIRSGEGLHFGFGGFGHHERGIGLHSIFDGAAEFLGLTEAELRAAKEDGQSLADIAEEQGKSVDDLQQATLAAARADLDEAVEAGDLTAEQRQEILDDLESRIDDIVQGTGFGFHHRGFGPPPSVDEAGEARWVVPEAAA